MLRLVARSCVVVLAGLFVWSASAEANVSLLDREAKNYGYQFNNGAEFPGAVGALTVDESTKFADRPSLKLHGDFTGGGGYVQAGKKLADVDIRDLVLTVRNPGADRFTLRLGDATGQTHQIVVKTDASDDWQTITLPLEKLFANRGKADAVTTVAKYEYWGGAKDGNWHGPATGIYLLLGKTEAMKVRTLWIGDVSVVPRPTAVAGAEQIVSLPLSEIAEGTHEWNFTNGPEFKGATGSLTVVADEPAPGASCLKLAGDFTGGGAYVAMNRRLPEVEISDVAAVRLRVKSTTAASVSIQLVDAAGQTHQRKGVKLPNDGAWHDFAIVPTEIAGGEHWGGANDGQWHGPPRVVQIALTKSSDPAGSKPELLLADIRAEAKLPVFRSASAVKFDFEAADAFEPWHVDGNVVIADESGNRRLRLERPLEEIDRVCNTASPKFALSPGRWEITLASECDLHSPDNSYQGVVALECLDAQDKMIERITVLEQFGRVARKASSKVVELPPGTAAGLFVIRLNKVHGRFDIDDVTVTKLAPAPWKDDRITRLMFATARLGNLLYPDDERKISVRVEAKKPLADSQRSLTYEVRDYWGAQQAQPATVPLIRATGEKGIVYTAEFDLKDVPLAVGRYYEVHASIPLGDAEPFTNFTSLAILPEAETKKYKPEDVPFTSRNWDNRITEFVRLTDRLGVRTCGLWGGWSAKPPYEPHAPQLELCRELGMRWLTTTPITQIERGNTDYDETALREGVRNFLKKYGDRKPLVINLGNEPHGTGDKVLRNVAAYKLVYDEIKRIDPTIPVVATSVEPNEEYFKAGYGQACDAFDFHIYEDSANVRRTINEYRALQQKYDCVKPIWSTELGLNSQGQTRHVVAVELVKKFATFFAAGGESVSWFGLLYPDAEGKSYGSSGDSHNVFDCRYNRYAPRLDAVAYYHMVNAVGIKKFVEEKTYGDDIHAFLFRDRDGKCLQVLWKDKGREDVQVPLAGVGAVRLIYIDGRYSNLHANGQGVTISVTTDPILLLYDKGQGLAKQLGSPITRIVEPVPGVTRRGVVMMSLALTDKLKLDSVRWKSPRSWIPQKSVFQVPGQVSYPMWHPDNDTTVDPAREAEFILSLGSRGELYHRVKIVDANQ